VNVEISIEIIHNERADLYMNAEMFLIAEENKSIKMQIGLTMEDKIRINGTTLGVYENVFKFGRLDLVEIWGWGLMDTHGEVQELTLNSLGIFGKHCY